MINYLLIGVVQTACLLQTPHYSNVINVVDRYDELIIPAWTLRLAIITRIILIWPLAAFDIFFKGY